MNTKDTFFLALRFLSRRRLRSWLTVLGILIGISAVVTLISLGDGLRNAVADQLSTLGADRLTIQPKNAGFGPPGMGSDISITGSDLRVVQKSSYVSAAAGRILKSVVVSHARKSKNYFLTSPPSDQQERLVIEEVLDAKPLDGRLLRHDDKKKVAVGITVATQWGDSPDITAGQTIIIHDKRFDVVGVMQKRGLPAVDQAIMMNEDDVKELLNISDEYQFIIAKAESPEVVLLAKESIEKDLRKHRGVDEREEDFSVQSSNDLIKTVDTILSIVTAVLAGIAAISIFVGGIGIMNTMYTAVVERTREIGIMKSIGATNAQILGLFLLESGLLGLAGSFLGVVIGVFLSKLVEIGASKALGPSVLQASTSLFLIISSLLFGFIVGSLAGYFPAKQAANMPPVEALRQ